MLSRLLDFKEGSMISIVGAGGKSTLMYTLAEELRKDFKVLVTTTTKIYIPEKEQYDYLKIGKDFDEVLLNSNKGIYVYGNSINIENKLIGVTAHELENKISYFDVIIIEADGSKRKSIKGWNDREPVICKDSNKTIGVLSIESIGKDINENNVHRVKEFTTITGGVENEKITKEHFLSLIFKPKGLYKNSLGEKILFINKVEDENYTCLANELVSLIIENNKRYALIDKVVIGSLKNKSYHLFNLN